MALTVAAAAGVLANDTDIDTVHTVLTAAVDAAPAHGTLTLNPDGSFTYTPFAGSYVGQDSFTYHANDGTSDSNVATVSLYIYVNHFPTAISDSVTVVSGSGYIALNLLANDNAANPDVGEVLHIVGASHPGHGTVVITGGGTGLSYRPTSGFIGTDVFSYTISDGVLTSSASVVVHVPKDTYKPTATPPVQTISPQTAGTSTIKVHLAWTGADRGYGVSKFELWQSTDGHSYKKIKTTSASSSSATLTVNHTYRFRVRAIDKKGNIGSYAYGPTFKFVRYQESSVVYTSTWLPSNSAVVQQRPRPLDLDPGRHGDPHDHGPDVQLARRPGHDPGHRRRLRRRRPRGAPQPRLHLHAVPAGDLLDHVRDERRPRLPRRLHRPVQPPDRHRRDPRAALTTDPSRVPTGSRADVQGPVSFLPEGRGTKVCLDELQPSADPVGMESSSAVRAWRRYADRSHLPVLGRVALTRNWHATGCCARPHDPRPGTVRPQAHTPGVCPCDSSAGQAPPSSGRS